MKHSFFYFLLIILISCTSREDKDGPAPAPSQETQLIDAVAKYPDSLLLRETLIQYYRDKGNYDMALAETNKTITRDSLNPRLYDIRATLYFEDGDTLQAIKAFEKAISIFPDPAYIISLGTLYAETKNPKALALADALILANKTKAEKEALFIKGLYYSYANQKIKAIPFFDQVLSINYTFMDAYREKAIALYDMGKYTEALAVLDKAVTLQNNFDEGYYYRGRILEKLNRKNEAIESYQRALLYDPHYVEALDALARLGIKQ
jgi:tetratricopeptide (TPR) repeat protein